MTDQTLRLLRGLTIAIAAVALPVAGHGMAGGPVTVTAPTVLVFLFVAALTTAISSREWTLPRIVAVLLPVQVLVHVALTAGGGAHAAHLSNTVPLQEASPSGSVSAGMLVAHMLALVAVVLWLRLAERALVRLVALAERLFCRAAVTAAPITVVAPPQASARQLIPLRRTRIVRPRAPPALSFV